MKNTVSIVIPIYNREKYIREAVESVENQRFVGDKLELIVVNDGSTDGTLDVLLELKAKSEIREDFHIINKENAGTANALNDGFLKSQGEFVGVLDSDDFLNPFAVSHMSRELNRMKNISYIWSLYEAFDERNGEYVGFRPGNRCKWPAPKDQKQVIVQNLIRFSTFHFKMMKKSAYESLMFPWSSMPSSAVDYAFVLKNMFKVHMRRVDFVAYYYRNKTEGSHSKDNKDTQKSCAAEARNEALNFALENNFISKSELDFIKLQTKKLAKKSYDKKAKMIVEYHEQP